MKEIIKAENKSHLRKLIKEEIKLNSKFCDLNHLDVSSINDMSELFMNSKFNGDISEWNVSAVTNMKSMFKNSEFNRDISKWNVCNVTNMDAMFELSLFNGDISSWNVSNVTNMGFMFKSSEFNSDISQWNVCNVEYMYSMFLRTQFNIDVSKWKPYKLINNDYMFAKCLAPIPYWNEANNVTDRTRLINHYILTIRLNNTLITNEVNLSLHKNKI